MTNRIKLCMATALAFTTSLCVQAQVTIGSDQLPETYSVLQLEGKYGPNQYGGLRMPRLTTKERDQLLAGTADKSEAAGLMIYNSTQKCMEYWNGRKWIPDNNCCPKTVSDTEGNTYTVGAFGDAGCWMTQNLRSTQYADGTAITQKNTASSIGMPKYYTYPDVNSTAYNDHPEYGLLYTWSAAANGGKSDSFSGWVAGTTESNLQGICPDGWVLPSDKDWTELEKAITRHASEHSSVADGSWNSDWESAMNSWRGSMGRAMKSPVAINGTNSNGSSNTPDNNGFNALLVGYVVLNNSYNYGTHAYFWSSSEHNAPTAWYRALGSGEERVLRHATGSHFFYSVRCKKNDN